MRKPEKGKSRKRNRKQENVRIGIVLAALLLIASGAVGFLICEKKQTVRSGESRTSSAAAGMAGRTEQEIPAAQTGTEAVPSEPGKKEGEEAESGTEALTEAAAETEEPSGSETAGETAEAETAEASSGAETQPVPQLLENLDSYKPGDVIGREQFDFENFEKYFVVYEIRKDGNVFKRINGRSYRENEHVALADLRYIQMPHYNFNGEIQLGEMIVNKAIAGDVVEVFEELFKAGYQIEKMYLIDNYWTGDGDSSDTNSVEHNNTSSFCYRESTGGGSMSRHAFGMAIDVNPQQNPYVLYSSGQPEWYHENANDYIARDTGLPHVITHEDPAYRLFRARGFAWGGDWENPKDYQHFEKR